MQKPWSFEFAGEDGGCQVLLLGMRTFKKMSRFRRSAPAKGGPFVVEVEHDHARRRSPEFSGPGKGGCGLSDDDP